MGSSFHPPLQKSATNAASRGASLLRNTALLVFLSFFSHRNLIISPGSLSLVQGQLTLHRWNKSLGICSPVQGKIDVHRLLSKDNSNVQFSLAPVGTIPWDFFHRCRVKWPCTKWISMLHKNDCSASRKPHGILWFKRTNVDNILAKITTSFIMDTIWFTTKKCSLPNSGHNTFT